MKKLILLLFAASNCFAQTVLLTPTGAQTVNTTKKGDNKLSINALRSIDNDFLIYNPGNSKLILSGDFFADNYESLTSSSGQSIEFNHLTTNRWTIRDYKFSSSIEPEYNIDAFQILNKVTSFPTTVFHIEKSNSFIGFNTDKPLTKLHFKAGGSGVSPFANTTFFVENNNHNYLHLGTPVGFDSGVLFSNASHNPSFGGSIIYKSDDRMLLQTDGNTRMLIGATGRVGINTTSPSARLHVFNGASGVSGTPADELIVENSANNYIQMMNPQANEAGLLFGLPSSLVSGGIIYNNAGNRALQFRTNNNQTQMTIDNTGNVGIGTTSPAAKLDVIGEVKIGSNGTVLTEVIKVTQNKDIASTTAGTEATLTFPIPNVQPNSTVYISPSVNLPDGLIIAHALCPSTGVVEVKFFNASSVTVNPLAMDFHITVIR